jgi:shikimate 5-dehydrogenase
MGKVLLLEVIDVDLGKSTFFVIGAGGASRAVCFSLAFKGVKKMYIVDKFGEASSSLVISINSSTSKCAEFVPFEEKNFPRYIAQSNVLINASGVGMHPYAGKSPVQKEHLRDDLFVADLIYNPLKSQILLDAEERGCKTMNGIEMQIIQGALGFSLWTGLPEPVVMMREIMSHIVARQR